MKPADFDPNKFERGQKYSFDMELELPGETIPLPVLLVRGSRPGKTLVVTAAVHGDEYEGVRAILEVFRSLDPTAMQGDFLAVPVAHPPAFWNGTRTSPLDGGNLARVFPGTLESGPTAAVAYYLANHILIRADFYLDLHSAGSRMLAPTLIGYDTEDPKSREAALIFGAPVVWAHPMVPAGRTVSFAKERGIPCLYTEARGAGRIHPDDLKIFIRGVTNLLKHLSILPGAPQTAAVETRLLGDGNMDAALSAATRGFLIPSIELLQRVEAGQELGKIFSLHGEILETFHSPRAGVVVLIRQWPVVEPGDGLFLVTGVEA